MTCERAQVRRTLRCAAFRHVREDLERLGDRSGLAALEQLFTKHQRKCEDCRR